MIVISAIDNLGKGAAGQAVQNANLMFGLPETAGLSDGLLRERSMQREERGVSVSARSAAQRSPAVANEGAYP